MTEINNQPGAIDLERSFAEQESIRNFLAPVLAQTTETVSHEVLFRFLLIAETFISQNIDDQKKLNGLKLGYERQVLLQSNSRDYRVESQFVADQNWRTDFETPVRDQVQLLTDPPKEPKEIDETDPNFSFRTQLMDLSERISEQLYLIYPTLRDSLEAHVYLFINLSPKGFNLLEPEREVYAVHSCPGCPGVANTKGVRKIKSGNCVVCGV